MVTGGISAYQSYKATGKVDWRQATKAAVGGAVSVAAVGLAVATGGTGLGIATLAFETYAGAKTALRGGTVADVTTSMAKAGAATYIGGTVLPVLPPVAKAAIGVTGIVGSAAKGARDAKVAVDTFNDPSATKTEKALSLMNL